jgi:hypothetical protein
MRGMRGTGAGAILVAGLLFSTALGQEASLPQGFEVVVTGVPRPVQLAIDRRTLVVLSPSAQGDSAGEIHRVELDEVFPVDVSRRPRVRIPFVDTQLAALGSMALEPTTRDLFLGEENGKRVYRLDGDERLTVYLDGLRRLPGGSALVFDDAGRLVLLDHADPLLSPAEERTPQALEQFRDEDYRGPLLFRLALDPAIPLPRRLDRMPPWFPRAWGGRGGGALLPRLVAVAPLGSELTVVSSGGTVFRVAADSRLVPVVTLPAGQYLRINMVAAADGGVFVSGGFSVGVIFHVSADGALTRVAGPLADPQGLALGPDGYLYVAESSLHRIVRFPVAGR